MAHIALSLTFQVQISARVAKLSMTTSQKLVDSFGLATKLAVGFDAIKVVSPYTRAS
jgi:hypothetical protein